MCSEFLLASKGGVRGTKMVKENVRACTLARYTARLTTNEPSLSLTCS